jgi:hypothetical protein
VTTFSQVASVSLDNKQPRAPERHQGQSTTIPSIKMDETPAPKSYALDKNLFLYTSLTSGSSHIVTATSRLETILKANRIPFIALDIATDDRARMIWGRKAGKDESGRVRKLPGLVQEGKVLGVRVLSRLWELS